MTDTPPPARLGGAEIEETGGDRYAAAELVSVGRRSGETGGDRYAAAELVGGADRETVVTDCRRRELVSVGAEIGGDGR